MPKKITISTTLFGREDKKVLEPLTEKCSQIIKNTY